MAGNFWLLKQKKPERYWSDPGAPEFYDDWRMKIAVPGRKPVLRSSGTANRKEAERRARLLMRALESERWEELQQAVEGVSPRRTFATLGEVLERYLARDGARTVKEATARRNAGDLCLVAAHGLDLWGEAPAGLRGVPAGSRVPDRGRIEALSCSVLDAALVRRYFAARQGGELDVSRRTRGNRAINSTLRHARDVFSKRSRSYLLDGLPLPELGGFLTEPLLPEADLFAEAWPAGAFAAMCAAADALPPGDPLGIVNLALRQTGLRTSELLAARRSWLIEEGGRRFLWVRDREDEGYATKGVRPRKVPLSPELGDYLAGLEPGAPLVPGSDPGNLVRKAHNRFVKTFIGGIGDRGSQGNHRLRDHVASVLYTLAGEQVAASALGHVSSLTTVRHYADRIIEVGERERRELAAWL